MPTRLSLLVLLVVAACDSPVSTNDAPAAEAETSRPNVLLVITDDQRFDDLAVMPKTQARLGLSLTKAYSTTSWCGPSRVTILRGQYAHAHGVKTNKQSQTPPGGYDAVQALGLESQMLPVWMHDAGYATGFFGKYINGFGDGNTFVPPGWDEFFLPPNGQYTANNVIHNGVREGRPGSYSTALLTSHFLKWLTVEKPNDGRPWFGYLAYNAPHTPNTPASGYAGSLASYPVPRPPSFNVPLPWVSLRHEPFSPDSISILDAEYRARLETLLSVDDGIATIVDSLGAMGQLANTLVIFVSDNAYFISEHALYSKNLPYEESIHVPMLVRGPGVVPGSRDQLVALMDLAPTILDYAGAPIPALVDGRSLRPVFENTVTSWRHALLIEHWRDGVAQRGLRTKHFFFSEWPNGVTAREVYDMRSDPWQMNNLKRPNDFRYDWMRDQTVALSACGGATCRVLEDMPKP